MSKLKNAGSLDKVDSGNSKNMADLIEENRRLQKTLAIAQEEREILKRRPHTLLRTKSKVCIYCRNLLVKH